MTGAAARGVIGGTLRFIIWGSVAWNIRKTIGGR